MNNSDVREKRVNEHERKRVSEVQKEILIEAMEKNPRLQACKVTSQYTIKHRSTDWKELANRLNEAGEAQKTVIQWQKCFTDMKSRMKKEILAGSRRVDGRILSIMKASAAGDTNCQENQSTTEHGEDLPLEDVDSEDNTNSTVFNHPISHSTPIKDNQTLLSDQTETKGVVLDKTNCEKLIAAEEASGTAMNAIASHLGQLVKNAEDLPRDYMDSGTNTDSSTVHNLPKSCSTPNADIQTLLLDQKEANNVVLDQANCEELIAAAEASGTAINAIASHLGQLVKVENRKAVSTERSVCALERTACAFERIANSLERLSNSLNSI